MTDRSPCWLRAEGEVAEQTRRHDWGATPLGPLDGWNASLRSLVELMLGSPQPVLMGWGDDRRLLYNDSYATTILGPKHPSALGRPFGEVWPELADTTAPLLEGVARGERQWFEDFRVDLPHRKEAPVGWFSFSWTPVRDDDGRIAGFYCTAFESTEKIRASEALGDSEARFRLLVESWAQAVWETPPDGRPTGDSPLWRASTGQSLDELVGAGWLNAVHPEDREAVEEAWNHAVAKVIPFECEYRARKASGGWQWVDVRASPLLDASGRVRKWVGMNIDITARREAEAGLRDSIARQTLITDSLPAMIGYVDQRTRYVWVNAEFERHMNIPREALIGRTMRACLPAETYLRLQPNLHAVLRGERVQFEECERDRLGPGRHGWTEQVYVPDIATDGSVSGFFLLALDITARKQAEADLRLSEERYRLAIGAFQGGVFGLDPRTGAAWGTEGYYRLLGDTADIWSPAMDAHFQRIHPDDVARVRGALARLSNGGSGPIDLEYRMRHADGRWRVLWTRALAFSIGAAPRPLLAATIDITERHEWQARLETDGERLRLALDVGRLASWDWDLQTDTVTWDENHFRLQGYVPGEIEPSYDAWRARVHPEDRDRVEAEIVAARDARRDFASTYRNLLPTGEVTWNSARGRFFYDEQDRAARMIGVVEDVTVARAQQEALAKSEARLRSLVATLPQLVFRASGDGARSWTSPQWSALTGLSEQESLGFGWLNAIHPEDRELTLAAWRAATEQGSVTLEHRIRDARSDEWRWHQTRALPVDADERHGAEDWVGTSTDIDEIRRLQGRQQTLLAELQHRVRNSLGVIRSIVRRTAETSGSIESMTDHLVGRIEAFARVQAAVTRNPAGGVDLTGLIEDELLAHATREGERLTIKGPNVTLGARAAESISLAIHELATNAVKHGALSGTDGRIAVDWQICEGRFSLCWKESGVRGPAIAPEQSGFGLELLLRSLPYDLGAETAITFEPGGVRFTLSAPAATLLHVPALAL